MNSERKFKSQKFSLIVLGAAVFLILALGGYFLLRMLALTTEPALRNGLIGFGLALFVLLGLLSWILARQFLGRYEEKISSQNEKLAEANLKLRELSLTDALTGLYNRRFFDDHFRIEFRQSRRTGRPLSLLLIDLDNFKTINDSYGHDTGDQVLLAVAEVLQLQVRRGGDLLARYGGEEFVAVLPETDAKAAVEIAERTLEQVRARGIVSDGNVLHVTASFGVSSTSGTVEYASEISLFRAADAALYDAKKQGKNRIMLAPGTMTTSTISKEPVD